MIAVALPPNGPDDREASRRFVFACVALYVIATLAFAVIAHIRR